ncbi:MAG: glycosyltransferase family 87 protein [Pseudomonadota bacterium]
MPHPATSHVTDPVTDPASATLLGLRPATVRLLGSLAVLALLAAMAFNLSGVQSLPGLSGASHSDFDMFHVVAQLALEGRIAEAYDLERMYAAQIEFGGAPSAMTWTYPPPFDLLLAPLGLISRDAAYLVFTGGSLLFYLGVVAKLSGRYFGLVLIAALPALMMSVRTGQNGTLIAALAGLTCLLLVRGRGGWAGVPLGLMVLKPHLGVGLGLWGLLTLRWPLVSAAVLTALAASAAATLAFGPGLWAVFLGAVGEAGAHLEAGNYRNYRMGSIHATLTSLGVAHGQAAVAQASVALAAILAVALAARRLPLRPALAVTLMATPLFSPYLYDYDLALYGPALALLLPELDRAGSRALALPIVVCAWIGGGTGLVQNTRGAETGDVAEVTFAGLAVLALALLSLVAMWRVDRVGTDAPPRVEVRTT